MNNPPGSQMAYAPGRVNLIGEHTDYNGGLALPMAINLGVRVTHRPAPGSSIVVESDLAPRTVALDIPLPELPQWARLAGAIATALDASYGARVVVQSNLPVGVGLSSSAAFGVAFALALGAEPIPLDIARLCQRAEEAVGVPVGLMDPLVSMSALSDHALLVDFTTLESQPVPLPPGVEVVVIDSGFTRTLDRSPYAARRRQCEDAAKAIGRPLGLASRD
ncbi:MAG: galactokinase, partial [Acidimicrobiales bacterium]